jgi:RNA polymerase sigma factor (sigma-70 family)
VNDFPFWSMVTHVIDRPTDAEVSEAGERRESPLEFADFFRSERARLFGTLAMVTGDRGEAEELMQEAFVRVWERWERVSVHPDPVGYLYRTAFNLVRQRRRRLRRAALRRIDPPPVVDAFGQVDDLTDVAEALRSLTVRQRAALVLTDLLAFDSAEAARVLGVKPGTVRSLASQGRATLRQVIGGSDE